MQNSMTPKPGGLIRLSAWRLIRHGTRGTYHLVGLINPDEVRVTSQVIELDQHAGLVKVGSGQTYLIGYTERFGQKANKAIREYCNARDLRFDYTDESALVNNPDLDFSTFLTEVRQPPHVILLHGLSGVGKAAVGATLSRIYHARLITHREIRDLASAMEKHANVAPTDSLFYARGHRLKRELDQGADDAFVWTDILIDGREDDERLLIELTEIAATLQARLIAVVLTADEPIRQRRIAAAGREFAEQRIEPLPGETLMTQATFARLGIQSFEFDTSIWDVRHGAPFLALELDRVLGETKPTRGPTRPADGEPE